jgi:hypothetical protein
MYHFSSFPFAEPPIGSISFVLAVMMYLPEEKQAMTVA